MTRQALSVPGSGPAELPADVNQGSARVGEHIQFLGYRIDSPERPGQRLPSKPPTCWRLTTRFCQL